MKFIEIAKTSVYELPPTKIRLILDSQSYTYSIYDGNKHLITIGVEKFIHPLYKNYNYRYRQIDDREGLVNPIKMGYYTSMLYEKHKIESLTKKIIKDYIEIYFKENEI